MSEFVGALSRGRWLRGLLIVAMMGLVLDVGSSCAPTKSGDEKTTQNDAGSGTDTTAAQDTSSTKDTASTSDDSVAKDTGTTDDTPPGDRNNPPADRSEPDEQKADQTTSDEGKACKDDCDCVLEKKVCESGVCSGAERGSMCPSCSGDCIPGKPCLGDGVLETCGEGNTCKSDCDCKAKGMNCEGNKCAMTDRPNTCPTCGSSNCPAGKPCLSSDGKAGTCANSVKCKHDCDCFRGGMSCNAGTCTSMGRPSLCLPCKGKCKAGDPCYNDDRSIGTCPGGGVGTACKSDCECIKYGLNCDSGKCNPSKRLNRCPACGSSNCPTGDPCYNPDKSLGTCAGSGVGSACKNDCECVKYGLNCDSGKCSRSRRLNLCPACSSSNCPKGDACYKADKSVGVCGSSLPSCNDKNCKPNTQCLNSNGTTGFCCCTIAGCGTGQRCCVTSGVNPGPGRCASSCLKVTTCPPPPP